MKRILAHYEHFYPHLGRLDFCGLRWGTVDRLLDRIEAPTWEAWGAACEALATEHETTQPRMAAVLQHFAQFKETQDLDRKRHLQTAVRHAFAADAPAAPWHITACPVVDAQGALPAWLIEKHPGLATPRTMILLNGLDSLKEIELWEFAQRFLALGFERCLLLDGPGQGEARHEAGRCLAPFHDTVTAAIATIEARDGALCRPVLFGVSFGGFLAMQVAQTCAHLRAAVCFSCTTDWAHLHTLPPELTALFQVASGRVGNVFHTFMHRECRLGYVAPQCPTLIVHGTHDRVMPVAGSRALREAFPERIALIEYADGHMFLHHLDNAIARTADWLRAQEIL